MQRRTDGGHYLRLTTMTEFMRRYWFPVFSQVSCDSKQISAHLFSRIHHPLKNSAGTCYPRHDSWAELQQWFYSAICSISPFWYLLAKTQTSHHQIPHTFTFPFSPQSKRHQPNVTCRVLNLDFSSSEFLWLKLRFPSSNHYSHVFIVPAVVIYYR